MSVSLTCLKYDMNKIKCYFYKFVFHMLLQNVFMVTQEQSVQLHVLIRYLEKIVKAFVTVQFRSVTLCLGAITVCTH